MTLQVRELSAGYDGRDVLHKVSFDVAQGDSIAIIGPNGCGKTTLLRAVSGIIPSSGSVTLDGRAVSDYPRRELAKKVAMLSQISEVYFEYSVQDTVAMGRYPYQGGGPLSGMSAENNEQVRSALEQLHLWELRENSIAGLSGGQLQRVFLARLIAQQPDIILLDEPTNHLDLASSIELVSWLRRYAANGSKSVIGVLHDLNLTLRLADRLLLLANGRVTASGSTREVLGSSALTDAYGIDVAGYMRSSLARWKDI